MLSSSPGRTNVSNAPDVEEFFRNQRFLDKSFQDYSNGFSCEGSRWYHGKEFSTKNSTLIDEAGSYAAVYFADFLQKKKLLNDLDFLELKVKTEPTKKSSRILLAKKQNSELLLNTPDLSPLDSGLKFPTTPSLGVNVIDINQLFGGNKPTPPFVRKITQKLSASVSAQITKSLTTNTSLEREQKIQPSCRTKIRT